MDHGTKKAFIPYRPHKSYTPKHSSNDMDTAKRTRLASEGSAYVSALNVPLSNLADTNLETRLKRHMIHRAIAIRCSLGDCKGKGFVFESKTRDLRRRIALANLQGLARAALCRAALRWKGR